MDDGGRTTEYRGRRNSHESVFAEASPDRKARKLDADFADCADLFLASLASSANFVLKASFCHRTLLSATGAFCNAPLMKLGKNDYADSER